MLDLLRSVWDEPRPAPPPRRRRDWAVVTACQAGPAAAPGRGWTVTAVLPRAGSAS